MIINFIFFVLNIYLGLLILYYFQIKEYRFDRIKSHIKEQGIWALIHPKNFVRPAIKIRNLIILGILAVALAVAIKIPVLLYLLVGIGAVVTGVVFTEPLAIRKRRKIVELAKCKLKSSKTKFIGITGSYGKTTTKEFLYAILATKYKTGKTLENQNTLLGAAIAINKQLDADTEYFVTEIGAYKKGEIKEVTDVVKPTYAILTGLGNQHIDLFGSQENLITAKKELIDSIPSNGTSYINADSDFYLKAVEGVECELKFYSSTRTNTDIFIENSLSYYSEQSYRTFPIVVYKNERFEIKSKLFGKHLLTNLLPCIALAYDLGMTKVEIEAACELLKNREGSLSVHKGLNGATFINESKNSNLNGFLAAIEELKLIKEQNRKYIITKGIIELGNDKESSYKKLLGSIGNIALLTTDKAFKRLAEGQNVLIFKDDQEILECLTHNLTENDVVLIEGRFKPTFINNLKRNNYE